MDLKFSLLFQHLLVEGCLLEFVRVLILILINISLVVNCVDVCYVDAPFL
jgi:hypothetical protein